MAENENTPIERDEYRSMSATFIQAGAQIIAPVAGAYATVKFLNKDKPKDPQPQEPPKKD